MNAVERYRLNRIRRMEQKYGKYHGPKVRFDDDDDTNGGNNGGGSKGSGHGNTRIPYGLCQREGIDIGKDWTPKDAWAALEGKGYSASAVYKELKGTGKVSAKGSVRSKKHPTKISESHFPESMVSKSNKKNTMVFANYVSERCDDGEITEFLSMATAPGAKTTSSTTCKKVASGEGCSFAVSFNRMTKEPLTSEITIPDFSKYKDEETRAQAIRTFAHEWTHYLDFLSRDDAGKYGHFSEKFKDLSDAIEKNDPLIFGEETKKLFKEYNKKYDDLRESHKAKIKNCGKDVTKKLYGDDRPSWLKEDGSTDYWEIVRSPGSETEFKRYRRECKKAEKAEINGFKKQARALMDGVTSLQGIYDSLSGGMLRKSGVTKYGHSMSYFRDTGAKACEALADYVALKATNPKLAEVFIKDKPEVARAMDSAIIAMKKRLSAG